MPDDKLTSLTAACADIGLSDVELQDILAAMSQAGGYLDITPDDALGLYRLAYRHATKRLRDDRPVSTLMTSPAHTCAPDLPAPALARRMAELGVSGLPVVEGDQVVGVVSIKDFLPRLGLPLQATPMALASGLINGTLWPAADFSALAARDLMTAPALTVPAACPVSEAAKLMDDRGINRLPVLEDGRLAGIITRGDLVRACRPHRPEA
jgi:Predicted signal-transduction protein containing cAMP-binding and CBS domains